MQTTFAHTNFFFHLLLIYFSPQPRINVCSFAHYVCFQMNFPFCFAETFLDVATNAWTGDRQCKSLVGANIFGFLHTDINYSKEFHTVKFCGHSKSHLKNFEDHFLYRIVATDTFKYIAKRTKDM